MKHRRTGGPDRQIYLRSDKNCQITGPTVRREIFIEKCLFWPNISIEEQSVLNDQSKSSIGALCIGNCFTIYCAVTDIVYAMQEPAQV